MSGEYERLVESSGSPSPRTAREQPPPGTPSPAREQLPQRLSVGSLNTDQSSPDNQVILSSVVKDSVLITLLIKKWILIFVLFDRGINQRRMENCIIVHNALLQMFFILFRCFPYHLIFIAFHESKLSFITLLNARLFQTLNAKVIHMMS